MTTSPVPAITDDQLEELAGRRLGDVLAQVIRYGLDAQPYRMSRERNPQGDMLWIIKVRRPALATHA
ncbi:hypothetical protein [Pseudomonas oryzihabitans]|uniref:hypothetical protein n=1 Tax=Pseudomonas oryzihabitans TaxID=47885 RepID=UPI002893F33A|nr:hypothetical protein [Pseudomonas oryzihabitans]MDT3718473.1 hypothetical protein [Pseudomonas oryzihabitans]